MKKSYLLRKILLVGLLFVIFSCDKEEFTSDATENSSKKSNVTKIDGVEATFFGPEVAVGNGFVHSWISFNKFQIPLEIGIEISPEVFDNLPPNSDFDKSLIVPLPVVAQEATPFDHIEINWNPENYSTIPGFKTAHLDFHFYLIPLAERMDIPVWSEDTEADFSLYPAKDYMPWDYAPITKEAGSFERMGRYWLSKSYDNTTTLTYTMALGTFKGAYVFICPVSSLNVLKSDLKINETISQPLNYPVNKLFPREYNVFINNKGNNCITLSNFVTR